MNSQESKDLYDIIILGSGPSGLTAAIYASRANLSTLVIGGNPPGGQLMWTTDVENFPGFPDGVTGPEFVTSCRKQAQKFGAVVVDENAVNVTGDVSNGFVVVTDGNGSYKGRSIIVATGATAKWLNLESEQRLRGKGVSACATCDGFFFRDKVIAVAGGGDSAMEEATFLTKFASKVYVLVRSSQDTMRASKFMQKKAMENPKIEFIFNVDIVEVLGMDVVSGVQLKNSSNGDIFELAIQGLFVAIGHKPNTDFLKGFIDLEKLDYAHADKNVFSSKEGVFVAGDVVDYKYRQAITAAGFGCMAALEAERFLEQLHN